MLPRLYLSRPATILPDRAVDNDEALSWARDAFRGSANDWEPVEQIIRWVFDRCNTNVRYLEGETLVSPGEFAAQAATACLAENGVAATDVDLLIYGGVARDAFEPATATEVAGRLGAKPLVALDVTCACAGLLEALHVAAGYFALHEDIQTALICSGEITRDRINYDMQNLEDVMVNVAGLTLGNAAAALLVTREALATGGARLLELIHKTRSEHWDLCRAPVDGHFTSQSKELFALSVHVVPEVQTMLARAGIDRFIQQLGIDSPAAVLQATNAGMHLVLSEAQLSRALATSMDVGLVLLDFDAEVLRFAGAKISLYWSDGETVEMVKGDSRSLWDRRAGVYQDHEMPLRRGFTYYMATDGVFDQAGGDHGFGLGTERFCQWLLDHASKPLAEQHDAFTRSISEFRGDHPQRDDITMFSFRVS